MSNLNGLYWTDDLSVGISQIDDDHKALFRLIEEAYNLSQKSDDQKQLYRLAKELVNYTQTHFKREEAVMSATSYPYFDNHASIHLQLIEEVQQQLCRVESEEISAKEFATFLKDWLIDHIKGSDQRIANYTVGYEADIKSAIEKVGPLQLKPHSHIYLVDDDEAYVALLQAMADEAGLSSSAYSSGDQFLEMVVTDHDLIILDLNMPGKDGIEVMRELTQKEVSPTFILISGFDERVLHSAQLFAESKQLKVAETLSKPIDTDYFIELLKKVYEACKEKPLEIKRKKEIDQAVLNVAEAITVNELKQAIQQNELIIYVQPQISFNDGDLTGVEVLVRWQHPNRGLVFPDQFIPLAEEHHMMAELTEQIITQSIKAQKQFEAVDLNLTVSINLSAQDLNDLAFPEKLEALLNKQGAAPESFILELTESEIFSDASSALDVLNRLRMKGFLLSIDDFGTGDSSLKRLFQSPFSELKIDQHFVSRIEKDDGAISIIRVCNFLAQEFKMHTVAEGIETQEIWNKLKLLGCDIAQGYFIARPMPVEDFLIWVKNR